MTSHTRGNMLSIQTLVILKDPATAPAGMFADACQECAVCEEPLFVEYAATVFQSIVVVGIAVADKDESTNALMVKINEMRSWSDVAGLFDAIFDSENYVGAVQVHDLLEDIILDAIKSTTAPEMMRKRAGELCDAHDARLKARDAAITAIMADILL